MIPFIHLGTSSAFVLLCQLGFAARCAESQIQVVKFICISTIPFFLIAQLPEKCNDAVRSPLRILNVHQGLSAL